MLTDYSSITDGFQGRRPFEHLPRSGVLQVFLNGKTGGPNDRPESAGIEFLVIRNRRLSEWVIPAINHVASMLALEIEAAPFQDATTFPAGVPG
jgi:hypothetical protein